jgi:prepilin-type N-terminal cleavage/methylation domain-containing protein
MRPIPRLRRKSRYHGFTLLELVIALSLVGLLLLGAHLVLDQLGDEGRRISARQTDRDTEQNGLRLLRVLVRRAEAGTDSSARFVGDEFHATFTTWCDVPAGWLEECRVTLQLIPYMSGTALVAIIPGAQQELLWTGSQLAQLRYFDPSSVTDPWTQSWGTSISLPAAVGIAAGGDTLVLPAAGR